MTVFIIQKWAEENAVERRSENFAEVATSHELSAVMGLYKKYGEKNSLDTEKSLCQSTPNKIAIEIMNSIGFFGFVCR